MNPITNITSHREMPLQELATQRLDELQRLAAENPFSVPVATAAEILHTSPELLRASMEQGAAHLDTHGRSGIALVTKSRRSLSFRGLQMEQLSGTGPSPMSMIAHSASRYWRRRRDEKETV